MANSIFLLLNGLGVAFLLYVLANFWRERHRPEKRARKYTTEFRQSSESGATVVARSNSMNAQGGASVIPFRTREQSCTYPAHKTPPSATRETPVRMISTR